MLGVLALAARLYARFLPVIVVLATILFGIAGLVEYLAELWSEHVESIAPNLLGALESLPFLFTSFVAIALLVLAEPLFAGLLDKELHPAVEGGAALPLRRLLAEFPFARVILTDLLLLVVVLVGLILLLVPGLVAYTLLGLAVPLVVAEDLRPVAAFRRSFALLRRNRVVALMLVLLPTVVAELLGEWLSDGARELPWWGRILTDVAFSATLPAYAGVVLAVLAVWLPRRTATP
jgi:hypothetical protein